ncbi:MAG: hypothetical protein HRT44_10460 [Bdellovibrionales bacterium]|nr:hypothetical protein [Bdellovibrionales bacterium]NQZ19662.1 hypothetical protein [Bdellovibrionales bacterium]
MNAKNMDIEKFKLFATVVSTRILNNKKLMNLKVQPHIKYQTLKIAEVDEPRSESKKLHNSGN